MAGKSNIVSFDSAKGRSRRSTTMRSQRASRVESDARFDRQASTRDAWRTDRRSTSAVDEVAYTRSRATSSSRSNHESEFRAYGGLKVEREDSAHATKGAARSGASWLAGLRADVEQMESPFPEYEYERSARRSSTRSAGVEASASRASSKRSVRYEDESDALANRRSRQAQAERENRKSSRETRRRERTKARADKMFSQQFEETSAPVEDAPRAAVYEGQMGARHRKSARMQRVSASSSPSARVNVSGWLSSLPLTPRSIKIGTTILCAFLVCVFLYAPAQQYYQAQREHDKLVVEYSTLEDRNAALNEQNDIMASDAGMEDTVRQKYGYVKAGEEVAYVAGLSDEAAARRDSDELQANVLSSTVKAPEEWYTPLLDAFFGVW